LWGTGVASTIFVSRSPLSTSAVRLASLPAPMPRTFTATVWIPRSRAFCTSDAAASAAATCEDRLAFLYPTVPAEAPAFLLPWGSWRARIVLFLDAEMCTTAWAPTRMSRSFGPGAPALALPVPLAPDGDAASVAKADALGLSCEDEWNALLILNAIVAKFGAYMSRARRGSERLTHAASPSPHTELFPSAWRRSELPSCAILLKEAIKIDWNAPTTPGRAVSRRKVPELRGRVRNERDSSWNRYLSDLIFLRPRE